MTTPLKALGEQGQSPWLDYISRTFVHDGELKQLVDDGIVGLTSNPTIFQSAIADVQADVAARPAREAGSPTGTPGRTRRPEATGSTTRSGSPAHHFSRSILSTSIVSRLR